jgi:predicted permease
MGHLKLAFRTLRKTPFVTGVAVLSLALGIGATTAIFSIFDQILLRALPVPAPERLVSLSLPGPKPGSQSCNQAGDCDAVFSYPMFRDLQREQSVFTNLAAHRLFGANLAYRGQTINGEGVLISGSYFQVLGVQPALGRLINSGDDQAVGESLVATLSHDYWTTQFGQDPNVLNEAITVNGHSLTIVGVAPRGFHGTTLGARPQVFVPITLNAMMNPFTPDAGVFANRRSYWLYVFGRLRPGVSVEQARAALEVPYRHIVTEVEAPLQTGMSDQTLARFKAKPIVVEANPQGQSSVHSEARLPMTMLMGVTVFVLLIACANIANLLLARSAARSGEMAVRLSIGAGRRHLIAQLLTEALLLAVIGGIAGLLVARWTLALIGSLLPAEASQTIDLALSGRMLGFAAVVTLGTGLLFGLFPALHSTRADLLSTLKGQSGQPSGARAAARFRSSLATAQIAISMALLISAGLFTKSLFNISRVDLGLQIDNLVTFGVSPLLNGYTPERSRILFERLEDELAALPGVTSVTASLVPLLAGSNWGSSVSVEGFERGPDTDANSRFNEIGPDYFRTLGIPLIAGREFTRADALGAPKVAIVNEAFAKKFNLGRDAVGKRMAGGGLDAELDTEIVGLVQNAKYSEVKQEIPPLFFQPYRQDERAGFLNFYIRTATRPEALLPLITRTVAQLDPNLPVEQLRTMPQQVRENVFFDRFVTVLSASFAALATLLAAIGLYGVLAYTVAQRTREIGLRMALGAAPGRVRRMVLGQVGLMTAIGGVVGLIAAWFIGPMAEARLYQLDGRDPMVFAAAAALLSGIACSPASSRPIARRGSNRCGR